MRLHNKVVFITDADSLSGQTLVDHLAAEGAHFILNSSSGRAEIQDLAERCQAVGSQAMVVQADLARSPEVRKILDEAEKQLGTVDILIHNNNIVIPASVESCDESTFLHTMNFNTKSAFVCAQAVGKQMAARQSGKMIFVSSIHAEKPTGSSFAYSVSRGALKLLVREAALELGRFGICVNSIEMGPVEGDDVKFQSSISTLYDHYRFKIPNAVVGSYDDLAHCVLFLATDEARYINGADIRLDGGFLLHYMDHKMKLSGRIHA